MRQEKTVDLAPLHAIQRDLPPGTARIALKTKPVPPAPKQHEQHEQHDDAA